MVAPNKWFQVTPQAAHLNQALCCSNIFLEFDENCVSISIVLIMRILTSERIEHEKFNGFRCRLVSCESSFSEKINREFSFFKTNG